MADPNLEIPPARNLPSVEDVMGELEGQPTPDVMQEVRIIQKVATMARNLNGRYVCALVEDGGP